MFTTAELNVCKQGGHGSLKFTTSFIHSLLYYILTYLPTGSVVTRSCALFQRIRGRPYCSQGGHGSLKFTIQSIRFCSISTITRTLGELTMLVYRILGPIVRHDTS